jgi:hypothetical protein
MQVVRRGGRSRLSQRVLQSQTHTGANMSLKIAAWKSWRPAEYFQEYCHQRSR